ncbi:hypothetical protein [Glaciihabitans sp. dw_435]|uniref:hypothetical protein n=1 Tax=Glaciihabitans sp. dw_435 TaxID=2720081 RepID=UPI001BD68E87|nr:hypothetical protein [Glaciihabitans sp. dw_435]
MSTPPRAYARQYQPKRDATREDRWRVAKEPGHNPMAWFATPVEDHVMADLRLRQKNIYFAKWNDAMRFALRKVYGK